MNRLKELRIKKGLTTRELSKFVSVNHSTITNLENGKTSLNDDYIKIFCSFYNVSSDYLLGLSNEKKYSTIPVVKLPIYRHIYANEPKLRHDDYLGDDFAPGDMDLNSCIYIINPDDSMKSTGLSKGDQLIIEFTNSAENNHVVVVAYNDDPGIVRRVIKTESNIILIADNDIPVITYTNEWIILARVRRVVKSI